MAELRDADPIRRDSAIARLRVLGSRTVTTLASLAEHDPVPSTRASALKALDGIDDPRIPATALRALQDADTGVRLAAIAALRPWVIREEGTGIMDALVTLALDRAGASAIRLAALDALSDLPRDIVQPILEQAPADTGATPAADEAADVLEWLAHHSDAPLSALHALVARSRERELATAQPDSRREWQAVRGAVHVALARRASRVALYDLRESFDAAVSPLPLDFLTAVMTIGDASCLEPMARAWAATPPGDSWWRARLAEAAQGIVRRDALTGRNAVIKRIRSRWAGFL